MNCPTCKLELKIVDRQGIESGYRRQCRGVLLDRVELDKIIERSSQTGRPERELQERYWGEKHRHYGKKRNRFWATCSTSTNPRNDRQ